MRGLEPLGADSWPGAYPETSFESLTSGKTLAGWPGPTGAASRQQIRRGNLTQSPDVVINPGTELSAAEIIQMWNQGIWSPSQVKNYAYGRAQSTGIQVPITKPVVRMYF